MTKEDIKIMLQGKELKYNPNPKNLGLTLDEKCNFNKHIDTVEQKAQKTLGIIRNIKGIAKQINNNTHINKLNAIQRKGLALCLDQTTTANIETLEEVAGILPLDLKREEAGIRQIAKIKYKVTIPIPIKEIFEDWKNINEPEKMISPIGRMVLQSEDMKRSTEIDSDCIESQFEFRGQSAIRILTLNWKLNNYGKTIHDIKIGILALKSEGIIVSIEWTPGHADIQGYCNLNSYKSMICPALIDKCSCGQIETVDHYLLYCENYEEAREKLRSALYFITSKLTLESEVLLATTENENYKHHIEDIQHLLGVFIKDTGSADVPGPGEATAPTINELMQTFYSQSQPSHRQLITLQGSDTVNSFSVYGQEVDVVASKPISTGILSQPTTGSNKVKITPVVKYDWEALFYVGNLVAIHRNNTYAAYTLRVVRIINRKTAERALLKDFAGRVIDIAFAHTDDILIGAVDEIGNLMVYHVKETDDRKLIVLLSLHIRRPDGEQPSEFHRVIWCPFIPDDCDDSSMTESSTQDASRVLVLTHNEKAEIWNIELVTKEHGNGPLDAEDVDFGLIKITSHTQPVMDAAFSPDGTALATASLDGEVKFFQVNMNESTSPRCLHQWKPHDGKKLSSLFFLDDHKNSSPDAQFWKFAVTGADNNQEIKIWSCESWTCLQTLTFVCAPGLPSNFQIDPCMKAALDLGAKYLILTDIKRKVLYVLQIFQDNTNNTAHFSSISEFILAQPCLSFAILDASKKKFKKTGEDSNLDDMTTGELIKDDHDDNEQKPDVTSSGVQIRLYTVHPKALQELQIRFQPESSAPPPPTPSISTVSHDDTGIQDALSDLSMDTNNHNNSQDLSHPLLLTPDAFTSSPRKAQADTTVEQTRTSMGSSTSSFTHVTGLQEELYSHRSSQGNQSVISEGSTITQTPNSKEYSPHIVNGETTPGSVPLPPVSSTEENELETPKSKAQSGENHSISLERLNNVCMDDFFDTQGSRQTNERTLDTASTTGFEVVEGSQKPKSPKESFDENDEEVAGVLGET
ncbi:unnamed protein product [Mytilus edulis]|uniref:Enhancer of mRNA-decapping protein 4 WD40 repeat region domain-containing protein n=1 Tax=Mytilus edulis TaxID=6550 RepID=A0A8S3RQL2_MYTED|nr:unnamed protein product [Mytilus edulis]